MRKYPEMARGAVRNISLDWSKFLRDRGTSITVSSATVESDPPGLTFGTVQVSGNVSTVVVTVPQGQRTGQHYIKWTATLSNSEVEPKSVGMMIVEHKQV